jgi:hypothetical protein
MMKAPFAHLWRHTRGSRMIGFCRTNCTMISGEKCRQIYRRIVGEAVIEAKILGEGRPC